MAKLRSLLMASALVVVAGLGMEACAARQAKPIKPILPEEQKEISVKGEVTYAGDCFVVDFYKWSDGCSYTFRTNFSLETADGTAYAVNAYDSLKTCGCWKYLKDVENKYCLDIKIGDKIALTGKKVNDTYIETSTPLTFVKKAAE